MKVFTPCDSRIAISPIEEPREVGSIALPDTYESPPMLGRIVSKGPEAPDWIEPGDLVVFPSYAGIEFSVDGAKVVVVEPSQLLGCIAEPD